MGDRNITCERCEQAPYYEGHANWCLEIMMLEQKLQKLQERIEALEDKEDE
jgi:hypothetical protein